MPFSKSANRFSVIPDIFQNNSAKCRLWHGNRTSFLTFIMAVIKATDADFQSALSSQPLTVVKYYADWCGSCKLISPKFRRMSEDARFSGIQFLEVNAEENEQARHAAGVNNLPFFASFRGTTLAEGLATSREESILEILEHLQA